MKRDLTFYDSSPVVEKVLNLNDNNRYIFKRIHIDQFWMDPVLNLIQQYDCAISMFWFLSIDIFVKHVAKATNL